MGRVYTMPLDALSVTADADQDIFQILAATGKIVILHSFALTSAYATDERLRLRLMRRSSAGSGGGAVTAVATDAGNGVAATSTCTSLVTSPGSAGNILQGWQWSQQGELLYLPPPEDRIITAAAGYICLHLNTAPGGTRTWSGNVVFEEQ